MKTEKSYNEMTGDEKAQAIYSKLKDQSLTTLSELLMDLSNDYTSDSIFTVDDWLEYAKDMDFAELIMIAQESRKLNINREYIRESIFYSGYKTSDDVLDLVSEDEAIDWIANALEYNDPRVKGLESMMQAN